MRRRLFTLASVLSRPDPRPVPLHHARLMVVASFTFAAIGTVLLVAGLAARQVYISISSLFMTVGFVWLGRLSVDEYRRAMRRLPKNRRVACGYNLTGNTSGVCPECGAAVAKGQGAAIIEGNKK